MAELATKASENQTTDQSGTGSSERPARFPRLGLAHQGRVWFNAGPLGAAAVVALIYAVLGGIINIMIPSGITAIPMFPSAGFALAVTLIGGRAALPGVILGALLFNVLNLLQTTGGVTPVEILAAALLTVGPTLQAAAGAAWLRRAFGYPTALDDARSVVTFVLSTPLISLISASLSLGVLVSLALSDESLALQSWTRWWLGDTIGILVMLPLTMIVFGQPRAVWRSRAQSVGLPLVVAVLVFTGAYESAVSWGRNEAMRDFNHRSEDAARDLRYGLRELAQILPEVEDAFFRAPSQPVTATDFAHLVAPFLVQYPAVQAIEWAETVDDADRAAFEAEQVATDPRFRVTEQGAEGVLRAAQQRPQYIPVTFVAPVSGNNAMLGYDLASSPVHLAMLRKASTSSNVVASPPLRLLSGPDREDGMLPIGASRPVPDAKSQTYILVVLRMEKVLAQYAAEYRGLLATRLSDTATDTTLYDDFASDATPIAVQTFFFLERQYRLENALAAEYHPADQRWEPWVVLSVGTFSFGLLSTFLLLVSGYSARVTARVAEHTRELTNAQRFLRQVIDCLPNPLFIKDASHRLVVVNDVGCAMLGRSREEVIGRDDYKLFPPEEVAVFREMDDLVHGSGEINENEEQITDADGNKRWILTRKASFENPDGQFLVGVITDLTARRKAELAVESLALEDALTSLPIRRLLQQLLSSAQATAVRTSSSIALLLIDLDQFKRINDTLGHSFGDELLVEVARRLREVISADDVVGRLGGDEFAVIARTSLDPSTLGSLAQRIVGTLSLPFTLCDVEVRSGASVGIAISEPSRDDGSKSVSFDSLLARADLALYAAKEAGRNTWRFFEPIMHERACAQLTIERELRDAIREQQLALQYQPIIRTSDFRVCGFEALIRWHHPQRNLVLPGEFIPIAKRNRQIIPITFWTLSEAIRQLAQWRTAGLGNIRVAVNLSTPAFAAEGLLAHVLDRLECAQVPGSALVVEVTEGALSDHGRTIDVLKALRAKGVQVAIDDFGAGYSSLGRLSEMPVDILKMDRSFLNGGEHSETILRAMTQLARNLGLATVVEGVETGRQFEIVRDAQADSAQGFGLCRPIPAENVPDWYARLDPQHRLIAPSLTTCPAA